MNTLSSWKDKALFTPGPLTTSTTTKQAIQTFSFNPAFASELARIDKRQLRRATPM